MPYKSEKTKERHRISEINSYRNLRKRTIEKLGRVCVICGFSDYRALQIDHINGGGTKERRISRLKHAFLHDVLNDDGSKYQLLCANCNWIKRFEKNEIHSKIWGT